MLRLGRGEELEVAAANMVGMFDELSDSHVLQAEYMASRGDHAFAATAFRRALDRGLPIFADGLARLFDAVGRYDIDHPRSALLENVFRNRVRGLLWSAWTPTAFSPGGRLDG